MTIQQQLNSPSSTALPFLYFPPFYAWEILMTSFYDVTIVCSIILVGKPLCMHRQTANGHLHTCWHQHQLTVLTDSTKCRHFVSEPIFVPVTYIYICSVVVYRASMVDWPVEFISLLYIYIYIYIYIYMQCSGIQSIYDQLTRGVHFPPIYIYIYICSVAVFKASMIDWRGGFISLLYIYIHR